MNALKFNIAVNEALAQAVPGLRPLVGKRVELTVREVQSNPPPRAKLTLDEFLAERLERPPGAAPVSLEALEKAIVEGATGRENL